MTPFAALVAVRGLARAQARPWAVAAVAALMAFQLLLFNGYLRVVTTGVEDPPARERAYALDAGVAAEMTELGATFASQAQVPVLRLLGYAVDRQAVPAGGNLHLTLYWESLTPAAKAYTVFTHLLGPTSEIAGQQDNMPVQGTFPTTCWEPGEVIVDPYRIVVDRSAAPGPYTLSAGLYDLASGARLEASGPTTTLDREVILATIQVVDE
jgi:hypothetical protein